MAICYIKLNNVSAVDILLNTNDSDYWRLVVKSGIYLVLGETGAGKSSFMYAQVISEMFNKERYRLAKKLTNVLIDGGYKKLTLPLKHICYTEYSVKSSLVGKHKYVTWECNAKKFGLPNNKYKMDFYPPYSVIGFDESQSNFDSRNWKNTEDFHKRGWETNRHMYYYILFASQFGNVDKVLRNLVKGVYYITEKWQDWSKDKYPHIQSFWKYKFFESYVSFENWYQNRELKNYKEEVFCYDGDIKKSYDGEVYKALWFKNREFDNYSQIYHFLIVFFL